jgi:hypothetical protein
VIQTPSRKTRGRDSKVEMCSPSVGTSFGGEYMFCASGWFIVLATPHEYGRAGCAV